MLVGVQRAWNYWLLNERGTGAQFADNANEVGFLLPLVTVCWRRSVSVIF